MREVVFVTRILKHYRVPFHQSVYYILKESGISYRLLYSSPPSREAKKNDLGNIPWAEEVQIQYLGQSNLCWQYIFGNTKSADLVIIGQENSLLSNYAMQLNRHFRQRRKVAFFGHGKNFQAHNENSLAERFKRFWLLRVDWWFAYTETSASIVRQAGFPKERITVFNNSIDTSRIRDEIEQIDQQKLEQLRKTQFQNSHNIGVYVGGMYRLKRLSFLIDAAKLVRAAIPDFQLLFIGAGENANIVKQAAENYEWVHYVGPKFGKEKTQLIALSRVFLMPGLVGLGVLDSFVYKAPMVTTNVPYHSPEIDYLKDGVNGLIIQDAENPKTYADAVVKILSDAPYRRKLQIGAEDSLATYTIEAMAKRFAEGVVKALN